MQMQRSRIGRYLGVLLVTVLVLGACNAAATDDTGGAETTAAAEDGGVTPPVGRIGCRSSRTVDR